MATNPPLPPPPVIQWCPDHLFLHLHSPPFLLSLFVHVLFQLPMILTYLRALCVDLISLFMAWPELIKPLNMGIRLPTVSRAYDSLLTTFTSSVVLLFLDYFVARFSFLVPSSLSLLRFKILWDWDFDSPSGGSFTCAHVLIGMTELCKMFTHWKGRHFL